MKCSYNPEPFSITQRMVKVKVKLTPYVITQLSTMWGSGGIAPLFVTSVLNRSDQLHAHAALATGGEQPVRTG
jgi:hypothetical protein